MRHEPRFPALLLALVALVPGASRAAMPMTVIDTLGDAARLTTGTNGHLYWTEHLANGIGYRTEAGVVGQIALGAGTAPLGIAAAADGTIWFTEYQASRIGRYNPHALIDSLTEFPLAAGRHPFGICAGPDGNMWFTESTGNLIGRITPTGVVTEFVVPTAGALPMDVALGADGHLWFTEYAAGRIGRISTTGDVSEYFVPAGADSSPAGIVLGPDGDLWFAERGARKIGKLHRTRLGSVTITEFDLPEVAAVPSRIAAGPDGAHWFTTDGGTVGRISTSGDVVAHHFVGNTTVAIGRSPDGGVWFSHPADHLLCRVSVAGDANRDGVTDVLDVFYLINYLFAGGDPPR
jgi:virginiamycin B lyase